MNSLPFGDDVLPEDFVNDDPCTTESESEEDDEIVEIYDRDEQSGYLSYLVQFCTGKKAWMDHSDLWDDGPNSKQIKAYNKKHPVDWDHFCNECCEVIGDDVGCAECRCDECNAPCRILRGVNYGCDKHPIL